MLSAARLRPRGALWSERNFLRLWAGQGVSLLGDQVTALAVPLTAVLVLDAGATAMGLLTAAVWLPHLLLSLPAGVWIDRRPSVRRVMVAADVGRAVLLASIPLAHWLGVLSLEYLLATVLGVGALAVLFDIAGGAYFLSIVGREHVVEAQSKLSLTRSLAYVGGPPVGGWLVQILSAPVALVADAASYLVSALFISRIDAPDPPVEPREPVRRRLGEGFRFVFGHPILRAGIGCTSTVNFFNLAFGAIIVLFLVEELHLTAAEIGVVFGVAAAGAVVGALVAPRVARRIGIGPAIAVGCVLFTAPLLAMPLAAGPKLVVIALLLAAEFASSVGVMVFDINQNSLTLLVTPQRLRPRQIAITRVINYGVRPLGAVAGGAAGAAFGLRPTLAVAAAGAIFGVVFVLRSPMFAVREPPAEPAG